jgi:hypothetical protein
MNGHGMVIARCLTSTDRHESIFFQNDPFPLGHRQAGSSRGRGQIRIAHRHRHGIAIVAVGPAHGAGAQAAAHLAVLELEAVAIDITAFVAQLAAAVGPRPGLHPPHRHRAVGVSQG